jgi:hypothetical protein
MGTLRMRQPRTLASAGTGNTIMSSSWDVVLAMVQ